MAKANKSSTRVYVEFDKEDLSSECQKSGAALDMHNAKGGELRAVHVANVLKHHGDTIKLFAPDGMVYVDLSLNFGKLSGVYDLPGAARKKSSKKAIPLKKK